GSRTSRRPRAPGRRRWTWPPTWMAPGGLFLGATRPAPQDGRDCPPGQPVARHSEPVGKPGHIDGVAVSLDGLGYPPGYLFCRYRRQPPLVGRPPRIAKPIRGELRTG